MHTILSAPLHLHLGSYLPGWVTYTVRLTYSSPVDALVCL